MNKILKYLEYSKLDETHKSVLYHATFIYSLINIIKSNSFILHELEDTNKIIMHKKYGLSCSRMKYGGYALSRKLPVVIVLDKERISNNYDIIPVDYYRAKGYVYKSKEDKKQEDFTNGKTYPEMVEAEERILSDKQSINDALSYILEIHVLRSANLGYPQDSMEQQSIDLMKGKLNDIPLYIYDPKDIIKFRNLSKSYQTP